MHRNNRRSTGTARLFISHGHHFQRSNVTNNSRNENENDDIKQNRFTITVANTAHALTTFVRDAVIMRYMIFLQPQTHGTLSYVNKRCF